MLCEVDELARELKGPVKRTRRMVHVELHSQLQKPSEPSLINFFTSAVVREEQTEREGVGHLGVVHLHVRTNLTGRLFWIVARETIDNVIRFRAVGHDALSIEKIA